MALRPVDVYRNLRYRLILLAETIQDLLFSEGEVGVWYDPSDLTSMYQDSAGTTAAVVGQPVGKILDKSGNGFHATQATSTARPILRQSGDLYYLEFDGVDDFLVTPSIDFSATDKMSVFAGVRKLSEGAGVGTIVEQSSNSDINPNTFYLRAPTASLNDVQTGQHGTAYSEATKTAVVSPITFTATGLLTGSSTPYSTLRINGAAAATDSINPGITAYGNYPLYIGRRGGTSLPANMHLYSLIVRGALSDAAQIASAETYVNSKTGAY